MRVTMTSGLRSHLTKYCTSLLPQEACGFIVGELLQGEKKHVLANGYVPVRNTAADRARQFEMDPAELTAALFQVPRHKLIGLFHSHPGTPPLPSEYDVRTAWHTLPTYWIVSLQNRSAPEIAIYSKEDFSAVREIFVIDDA